MHNTITISAEVAGLSEKANLGRTHELASILEQLPSKEALGCYKGSTETSFVIKLCPNFTLDRAIDLAAQFQQESILFTDSGGVASLFYTDGSAKYDILGTLVQVNKEAALQEGSYTKVSGKYYIVEGGHQ